MGVTWWQCSPSRCVSLISYFRPLNDLNNNTGEGFQAVVSWRTLVLRQGEDSDLRGFQTRRAGGQLVRAVPVGHSMSGM